MSAAERHRTHAGHFTALVAGVADWSAPAPVAGWTALDVVRHLVERFPGFMAAGGHPLPPGPDVAADPVAAWAHQYDAVQALLDDPDAGAQAITNPHIGEVPLPEAVDRFYTADVFMHSWDLAVASGQDETLDPVFCQELLDGMTPIEDMLRSSGQYGPRVDVSPTAPVHERLMGFIGRDPAWSPTD